MVARGAGAAGPVLLACRQWDRLGLAQRLPSLGVGAWRSAPLLPWRVQCPVRVCAALVAGLGGSGRYLVLCLSRFPLPAPRVLRCVWRAVPSGCPLPLLAGTPFHAVPSGIPRVPFACVCAPAPAASAPPPPWVVWRAHHAQSRHWALVGLFHVVRAPRVSCPSPLLRLACLGGGGPVPVPPYLALGCAPPVGRVRGVRVPGGGLGGGGRPVRLLLWARACGCGGRRCPLRLHALWGPRSAGVVGAVPGGVACHRCEGHLVSGAVPPPVARPLGGPSGSATHMLWARGAGVGARHCFLGLHALWELRAAGM